MCLAWFQLLQSFVSVNKLLNGATLQQGQELKSPNGQFALKMQNDGNLVLYKHGRDAIWSSGTYRKGGPPYKVVMQTDNNLVLYDGWSRALWSSGTHNGHHGLAVAILQDDGNFVVYGNHDSDGHGRNAKWSTNTHHHGK